MAYAFTHEDGVAICSKQSSIPEGATWSEITPPESRDYREAWVLDTDRVAVVPSKAKDMALTALRAKRDAALEALDKEYLVAQRSNQPTTTLDAQRNTLLDATETLKAVAVDDNVLMTVEEAVSQFKAMEDL